LLDPVDERRDARVDAGFVGLTAVAAEANDAVQPPAAVDATDERTAGVSTTRVLATLTVAGTQHVVSEQTAVERPLTTLCLRDDWHHNLPKN